MAPLRQIFEMTAGADVDALLATPDLTYVVQLLRDSGETLSMDDLEQIYADEGWLTDKSFTWLELQALQHKIQTTAVNADLVDTTANTVDSAHQHLHPGPAEDSVRAHVNEETTLLRVLAVDVALLHDRDRRRRLEVAAGAHVLERVEELGVVLVRLVAELVARVAKDRHLVAVLLRQGIHRSEVLGRRASQRRDVQHQRGLTEEALEVDRRAVDLVG